MELTKDLSMEVSVSTAGKIREKVGFNFFIANANQYPNQYLSQLRDLNVITLFSRKRKMLTLFSWKISSS
jgi:hypothetical protein